MGTLADSLFSVLMSWVRALVSAIWALFGSERTTILEFLGRNWIGIAVLLVAAGLVIDWLIWLIRWQPYHIWAMRARRLLHIADPGEEDDEARAAYEAYEAFDAPQQAYMPPEREEQWMPLAQPEIGEEEAQQVMDAAEQVPDESLGRYPGMRYDSKSAAQENLGDTRPFAAVHTEGPGAAEVSRRRAEIDAWQKQMQEEARQKAEAERAAREVEAARARAAREAEEARLAQEAYEAEQARLAQEAYARELEEYERQRAQYERDLAEYERQKAEYEAAVAAQQAAEKAAQAAAVKTEFAQENPQPASAPGHARRRRRSVTYSDYVEGEQVEELPAPPEWTQMRSARAPVPQQEEAPRAEKKGLLRSGMARMAQMIEPEHEEVMGIASLPPRVDMHAAYKPAKKPVKDDESGKEGSR